MKIYNIEPLNLGKDGQEIAAKCLEYTKGADFQSQAEFDAIEGQLITKACRDLGWYYVPDIGGLSVEWDHE